MIPLFTLLLIGYKLFIFVTEFLRHGMFIVYICSCNLRHDLYYPYFCSRSLRHGIYYRIFVPAICGMTYTTVYLFPQFAAWHILPYICSRNLRHDIYYPLFVTEFLWHDIYDPYCYSMDACLLLSLAILKLPHKLS